MAYIKKQDSHSLRKFKMVGLASTLLGSYLLSLGHAQADVREVNLNGLKKTFDPGKTFTSNRLDYSDGDSAGEIGPEFYNGLIKSVELIPSSSSNRLRYRITLKDGEKVTNGGKLIFSFNGPLSMLPSPITMNGKNVGVVSTIKEFTTTSTFDNLNSIKDVDQFIQTFEGFDSSKEPVSSVILKLHSEFSETTNDRVIEFEIERSSDGVGLISDNPERGLVDSSGRTHSKTRSVSASLINPYDGKGVASGNIDYSIHISPAIHRNVSSDVTTTGPASTDKLPVIIGNIPGIRPGTDGSKPWADANVPGIRAVNSVGMKIDSSKSGYPSVDIIQAGDLFTVKLKDSKFLTFEHVYQVGDVASIKLNESWPDDARVQRFTNSSLYFSNSSAATLPDKLSTVRFELVSQTETSSTWKALDSVTFSGNHITSRITSDLSFNPVVLKNDWVSQLGNDGLRQIKNDNGDVYPNRSTSGSNIMNAQNMGVVVEHTRNGMVVSKAEDMVSVSLTSNSARGDSPEETPVTPIDTPRSGVPVSDAPNNHTPKFKYVEDPDKEPTYRHEQPPTSPGEPTVVTIGTKPTKKVTEQPYRVTYEADNSKDANTKTTKVKGKTGTTTVTTTYTINQTTGEVEPHEGQPEVVPPVDEIIQVGIKPKVVVTKKYIDATYIPDETKPIGYRELETPGSIGSVTTTKSYTMDDHGNVTAGDPKIDKVEPKPDIYRVGTKPEEVSENIPITVRYVPDETHDRGWTEMVDPGSEGHRTSRTTYYLSQSGNVNSAVPVITEVPMKPKIIKVGVKPIESTQTISAKVVYEADPSKDKGTTEVVNPGKDGTIITKIPYVLKPNGDVVEGTPVVTNGTMEPKVIKVGTKPKVVEEEIPFTTTYEHDDTKANGEEEIVNPGKVGHKTTTTPYILRPDGTIVEGTTDVQETPMEPRVIKTGSKPKIDQKDIPITIKYERDDTRDKGTPNVEIPGKAGYLRTTTPYTQGPDGKLVPGTPVVDKVDMVPKVIKVGTKPTVTTTKVPMETRYERDDTVDKGVTKVVNPGSEGITTTTIKHKLNDDGSVTDESPVVDKKDMTPRVIKVGTKPKVDVQTIPATVKYEFDPNKGDGEPEIVNPGRDGRVTITTPYVLNPDGTVVDGKPIVDKVDMVPKVVKVGNKPHVDVREIPVETVYEPDDSVDVGVTTVIEPGKPGKVTTTTPLEQGPDGKMVPGEPKVDKVDMTPRRVKVGTKPKVTSEDIPVTTRYERDDNNDDVGKRTVVNPGKPGKVTTTTPYVVGKDGHVTPGTPKVDKIDMVPRVVKVGTKPKVTVEEIPAAMKEVPDPSMDKGKTQIVDQGKPGRVTTTTPVVLNPDGSVSDGKPVVTKVDMTPRVVKVGTKSKDDHDNGGNKTQPKSIEPLVDTKDIPVVTVYQPDDTLDKGKTSVVDNGTPGRVVTTTPRTQMPDGSVVNGNPTVNKVDMKPKVVKVGTKSVVDEKVITIDTVYKPVNGSDIGARKVVDDGQEGRVTTTKTYSVDDKGQVIANEPVVTRVDMRPRVVEVVVGDKTNTKVVSAPVRYEKDPNRDKGLGSVKTPGRDGSVTTTTKYELDPNTGEVIPKDGQPVEIQAVPIVVKVPAKDKVEVVEIPIETEYVDDANLFEGQEVVEKDGKVGRVTTTITYEVNPNTGEITEGKPVIETVPMEKRIVRRGTKSTRVNIQVRHYLDGTNTEVASSQTLTGEIGKEYQTSPVSVPDKVEKVDGKIRTTHYELVKTPSNAKGVATKDGVVDYFYKAIVSEKDDAANRNTHDEKQVIGTQTPVPLVRSAAQQSADVTQKSEASTPKSLPKTGDSNLMSLMATLMTMTGAVTVPRRKRKK